MFRKAEDRTSVPVTTSLSWSRAASTASCSVGSKSSSIIPPPMSIIKFTRPPCEAPSWRRVAERLGPTKGDSAGLLLSQQ